MKNLSVVKRIVKLSLILLLRIHYAEAQAWVPANNGNVGADITGFVTTDNKIYASSNSSGVFVTDNDPIHWSGLNGGLGSSFINALFSYAGNLYAGSYGDGVYVSHDNGGSWDKADSGFWQTSIYVNAFASFDTFLYVGNDDAGYYSTDSGSHWNVIPWLGTQEVKSFAIDGAVLYAGSNYGMHVSMDSGATWPYANNGLPVEGIIWNIAISGNRVLCNLNGHGLYATTDSGANWTASSSGIPSTANKNITSLFADGDIVYAGTDSHGIYRSSDGGVTWSSFNLGQDFSVVTAFCKSNGTIFMGTDVDGIFKLDDIANGVASINSSSMHLYPNPAQNEIFIRDDLNQINEIRIVDAVGRCIMITSMKGETSKQISIQNFSPGIYSVIADNSTSIKFQKY